jgi:hypothetical protein
MMKIANDYIKKTDSLIIYINIEVVPLQLKTI